MALKTHNPLILLVSVLIGVLLGELLRLDDGVRAIGSWAERRMNRGGEAGRVSLAFITTSLIFCVGPLTVLGSFKSTLDGVTAIVFAATLGWGVILSAVSVLVVQGSLTLVAFLVHAGLSDVETAELTAAGGIAVLGIALGLLELRQIKVANFLPSLVVAPVLAAVVHAFGAV